jgi:DNA uptake protein ComE-like DNA-binding protein
VDGGNHHCRDHHHDGLCLRPKVPGGVGRDRGSQDRIGHNAGTKERTGAAGNEAQAARDELERIQYGRDKERGSAESRTKELEDRVKQLASQNRSLRQEYEDTKRHNETLKSLVARYQKELKDQSRSAGGTLAPTMPPTPALPGATAPPAPSSSRAPDAMGAAGGITNVNRASSSEMVLLLGLPKDVADRIVSNRPYKVKGELVAKNVVPKETFDMIKDRISVSP